MALRFHTCTLTRMLKFAYTHTYVHTYTHTEHVYKQLREKSKINVLEGGGPKKSQVVSQAT